MSDIQKVIDKINKKPYVIRMGAGNIAAWLKVSSESVREAKKILRREKMMNEVPENKMDSHSVPKILILDIETAPLRAYVWSLWKQNVYIDQIISNWFMLSWAAKWLLEPGVMSQKLTSEEARLEDDSRIVETLWHLLNQADVVIAHNGEKFDVPRIKSRFLVHGLPPTTFYQQIDTKKVAKREFGFSSNKLDALAKIFGIGSKIKTDFELWSRCVSGDTLALGEMEDYNRHDVVILEEIYIKLRPYIKSHPNYNLYIDSVEPVCPNCGHPELEFAGFYYFTPTGKYRNYRCMNPKCGALARERKSVYGNSKTILVGNGR